MAERAPDRSGSNIVLLGSFNPSIFQPQWFGSQNLLPQSEVASAEKVTILERQVCQFETERFVVQATNDRFVAASKPNTSHEPLKDLVLGTFFVLEHTPVTAMGLNRQMHFAISSEEAWHLLGDRLAPKDGWKEIMDGYERPGMLSVSITALKRNTQNLRLTIKVEPSTQVKPRGAYFETNHHFKGPEEGSLKALMKVLNDEWESSQTYAAKIANHILDWASK